MAVAYVDKEKRLRQWAILAESIFIRLKEEQGLKGQ